MTLNVSNIQHFSTGDGPGIRTTVFLKGCNLRCPWCHNPETVASRPQTLVYPQVNREVSYGKLMTVEEILSEVMEDADFYRAGGGGVTVSGGEPLLQSEGVAVLAAALKEKGVSTIVDTAGCVPWACFEQVVHVTDTFYFDYKSGDDALYEAVIGGNRVSVYENLCRLIHRGARVHVRIPLIPDVNMTDAACIRMCEQLTAAGVTCVDLLPFHRLGSGKYEAMGKEYAYRDVPPSVKEEIERVARIYSSYFENVTIEK